MIFVKWWAGILLFLFTLIQIFEDKFSLNTKKRVPVYINGIVIFIVIYILSNYWLPLGPEKGVIRNIKSDIYY